MASLISHVVASAGIGAAFYRNEIPKRVWFAGALCAIFPDLDVVGFHFGVRYEDFWGHRGFTHSLVFAGVLAFAAVVLIGSRVSGLSRIGLWSYFFLAAASHGVLDAMTNGGLGVAFFSPFDNFRYFLPWRPILVSPIGVSRFWGARGIAIIESEILCIWIPAGLFAIGAIAGRTLIERLHRKE